MCISVLALPTLADKDKVSEMPSIAFLEFLAELEQVDGKWISPTDLMPAAEVSHVDADCVENMLLELTQAEHAEAKTDAELKVLADTMCSVENEALPLEKPTRVANDVKTPNKGEQE